MLDMIMRVQLRCGIKLRYDVVAMHHARYVMLVQLRDDHKA
jgi:hypothetical protein